MAHQNKRGMHRDHLLILLRYSEIRKDSPLLKLPLSTFINAGPGKLSRDDEFVRVQFSLFSAYEFIKILNLDDLAYEEGVRLFYANMSIPNVPEGFDAIIRSVVLNKPIDFNFSLLCEILDLPNIGEHCFLTMNDKVTAYGHSASKIYSTITIYGKEPKTSTLLKPSFRVISKWLNANIITQAGHSEYLYPLQSLFLFSLTSSWKINSGYIIFETMRMTNAVISSSKPPVISKLSLLYGLLLSAFFDHFHVSIISKPVN